MQDEEIPSNQTFAEAIEYMGDKVANWFKGINDSADMHTTAVINLRPCDSVVTDTKRTAIRNAFLEEHAPVFHSFIAIAYAIYNVNSSVAGREWYTASVPYSVHKQTNGQYRRK